MSDRVLVNAPASRSPRSVWIVNESKTITHRSIVGFKLIPPTPGPNDDVFIRYEQIQPHIRPDRHESSLQEFHYITGDWEYIGNRHDCAFALNLCRRVAQIVMPDHGGLQTNAVISNTYHAIVKRMKKLFVQTDVQYHATVAKSIGGRLRSSDLSWMVN
ncbi:hypothetical protein ACOME3_008372 [Neoechinorhynchus agilis]